MGMLTEAPLRARVCIYAGNDLKHFSDVFYKENSTNQTQHQNNNPMNQSKVKKYRNASSRASKASTFSPQQKWKNILIATKRNELHRRKRRHQQQIRAVCFGTTRFDKHLRYLYSIEKQTKYEMHRCKRRAVLFHPDGCFSPITLLPYTNHKHGVIGSLLGGAVKMVAANVVDGILCMGLQDNICDEAWDENGDGYRALKLAGLVLETDVIFGRCIVFKLIMSSTGHPILGDLPLLETLPHTNQVECTDEITSTPQE